MPSTNLPTNDTPADDLPHLERLTESGVWEFFSKVKVERPKERSSLAERLWPFKPKSIQLDND